VRRAGDGEDGGDLPTPPKYDLEIVSQVIFFEVLEHHPTRLTVDELVMRIVADPNDDREVEVAVDAVRHLRRACLVRYRNDDKVVEPTQAALRARALLTV
jgi:hypothetical protein